MPVHQNHFLLALTTFICGGIVMIFELSGVRVLGPYFGTSLFVWTSLIGIILASLSVGYFLGGRLADRYQSLSQLGLIIIGAGVLIALTAVIKDLLLPLLQTRDSDIRLMTVGATLLLFTPASVLLGMVLPYVMRLMLSDIKTAGGAVGQVSALSTFGSISGTFAAGFFLIPLLGTHTVLLALAAVLFCKPLD